MDLKFKIDEQSITRYDTSRPTEGSIGYLYANFTFSDDWNAIPYNQRRIIFQVKGGEAYSCNINEELKCLVPSEVITTNGFYVSAVGVNGKNEIIKIPTSASALVVVAKAGVLEGQVPYVNDIESDTLECKRDANKYIINIPNIYGVKLEFKEETGMLSLVGRDEVVLSEIDLPTEHLIKKVDYDSENKQLVIAFENGQTVNVPMKNLFNTYLADEETLTLNGQTFSIKKTWIDNFKETIIEEISKVSNENYVNNTTFSEFKESNTETLNSKVDISTFNTYKESTTKALNDKLDKSTYEEEKANIEQEISLKANASEVYTKQEIDDKDTSTLNNAKEYTYTELSTTKEELSTTKEALAVVQLELHSTKAKLADLSEALNGYVLSIGKEEFTELSSAVLPISITIDDTVYNVADNVRTKVASIKGRTKKASNMLQLNDKEETTINGITYSIKNGVITLNGTATSSFSIWNAISLITLNGNYYYKPFTSGAYSGTIAHSFRYNQTQNNINLNFNFVTLSNQENIKENSILMYIVAGATLNNFIVKPMLVEGSTAPTTFERGYDGLKSTTFEGVKVCDKTINLVDKLTLNGVGTAQDELKIIDNGDGSTYSLKHIKNVGLTVLNKTTKLTLNANSTIYYIKVDNMYVDNNQQATKGNVLCDKLNSIAWNDLYYSKETTGIGLHTNRYIGIATADYQTMIDNDLEYNVYYELDTPIETVLKNDLTINDIAAIRKAGGTIEVVGNDNESFNVKPDVVMDVVYKNFEAEPSTTSVSESESDN